MRYTLLPTCLALVGAAQIESKDSVCVVFGLRKYNKIYIFISAFFFFTYDISLETCDHMGLRLCLCLCTAYTVYTFRLSLFLISFRTCWFLRCTPYYAASKLFFVCFFFLSKMRKAGNAFDCTHFSLCCCKVQFRFSLFFSSSSSALSLILSLFTIYVYVDIYECVQGYVRCAKQPQQSAHDSKCHPLALACFVLYLVYMLQRISMLKNDYFIPWNCKGYVPMWITHGDLVGMRRVYSIACNTCCSFVCVYSFIFTTIPYLCD